MNMNINPMQLFQMANQLKSNPMSMLGQFGIPQDIANNPQAIVQNLMNRGVVNQNQYNRAMQMAKNFGIKL